MDSYHSIVWPMVGNRWKPLQCIAIPLISMVARLKNHLNSIGTKLFMQWQWWRKKHNIFTIFCWRRLGLKTNWSCYDLFELAPRAERVAGQCPHGVISAASSVSWWGGGGVIGSGHRDGEIMAEIVPQTFVIMRHKRTLVQKRRTDEQVLVRCRAAVHLFP